MIWDKLALAIELSLVDRDTLGLDIELRLVDSLPTNSAVSIRHLITLCVHTPVVPMWFLSLQRKGSEKLICHQKYQSESLSSQVWLEMFILSVEMSSIWHKVTFIVSHFKFPAQFKRYYKRYNKDKSF